MPLIRSAITFATQKVSESVSNHQKPGNQNFEPQNSDKCNYEDNLSRQNNVSQDLGPHSTSNHHAAHEEQYDPRQQPEPQRSTDSNDELYDGSTRPPPPPYAPNQTPRQSQDNDFAHYDAAHEPNMPRPTLTRAYAHPGQQYVSAEQAYASEDRNRADYYQAKYYQAQQQAQAGQYGAQSAQFGGGDDDGVGYYQQSGRRGRGGGRGRGRRGRGGLIGMLLKK